jgi:hypothetical protein
VLPTKTCTKRCVNKFEYYVSVHSQMSSVILVEEGGANGVVAGGDVRFIFKTSCTVDIQGTDNHQVKGVTIGNR